MRARLMVLALALSGCAHHQKVVMVDTSRHALEPRGHTVFAFRDDGLGMLGDEHSSLFFTRDGGVTWSKAVFPTPDAGGGFPRVSAITWTSNGAALVKLEGDAALYRTRDGGLTFDSIGIPLRREEVVHSAITVGHDIWLCGRTLLHSTDDGESWQVSVPPTDKDSCKAISFADQRHGWRIDGDTLYTTDDAGQTWVARSNTPPGASDVLAISADTGFVFTDAAEGDYRSVDGGVTLVQQASHHDGELHIAEVAGHRVVVRGAQTALEAVRPARPNDCSIAGPGRIVVREADGHLAIHEGSAVASLTRLLGQSGPSVFERIRREGSARSPSELGHEGVSDRHVFVKDDRLGWLVAGDLPPGTLRVGFAAGFGMVAQTAKELFTSTDGGRRWELAYYEYDLWTRFELDRALGEHPRSPMACTVDSAQGAMRVYADVENKSRGKRRALELTWNGETATIQGESVPLARVRALVFEIVTAASRAESYVDEGASSSDIASVGWACKAMKGWATWAEFPAADRPAYKGGKNLRRARDLDAIVDRMTRGAR